MEKRDHIHGVAEGSGERVEAYSEDGVDLTLIRWMLSMSPSERLRVLERNVAAIMRLRRGRNA